jgi:uncharacterized membrane protein
MITVINRAIILPIIAGIALIIKLIFGLEIDQHAQDVLADAVLAIVSVIGIFMQPKKKTIKKKQI